jgi:hypothetical protein
MNDSKMRMRWRKRLVRPQELSKTLEKKRYGFGWFEREDKEWK